MTGLTITLSGADQLARTAHAVADQLRAGLDHDAAAEEVVGYITHPRGTPAGVARGLRVEPTDDGFALVAAGTSEPFLARFLGDPFDARSQAVVDEYAHQVEQLLDDTLRGA